MSEDLTQVVKELKKTVDGFNTGLGAMFEVMQKQEAFLAKAEEDDEKRAMEELERKKAEEEAKKQDEMAKSITAAVVKQLMELGGTKVKSVAGQTKWPMSANAPGEDQEKPVKLETDTDKAQRVIQASTSVTKQDMHTHCPHCEHQMEKAPDMTPPAEATEFPKEEDETKEYPEELRAMAKENSELKKSLEALKKQVDPMNIQKMIGEETDKRLKQHGWHKEQSSMPTPSKSLGVEELPIKKADSGDPTKELANQSYSALRKLQVPVMMQGMGIWSDVQDMVTDGQTLEVKKLEKGSNN